MMDSVLHNVHNEHESLCSKPILEEWWYFWKETPTRKKAIAQKAKSWNMLQYEGHCISKDFQWQMRLG